MRQKAANWAGGRGKPGVATFGHSAFYTTLSALALSGVMPFG